MDVAEVFVYTGEPDEGNLIDIFYSIHDSFTNCPGWNLVVELAFKFGGDIGDEHINLFEFDRSFFTGTAQAGDDFCAIKLLAASIIFEDVEAFPNEFFGGGEAMFAFLTDAPASDCKTTFGGSGINDTRIVMTTFWALHSYLLEEVRTIESRFEVNCKETLTFCKCLQLSGF